MEDFRKVQFIEGFLRDVSGGKSFIQDIWIDRSVQPTWTDSGITTANASSPSKSISSLEELLHDDLSYCLNEGIFTFRFIAAVAGSGKTTLLRYLQELINVTPEYFESSLVIYFELSKLLMVSDSQSFGTRFYSRLLAETLWKILKNTEIKDVAVSFLRDLFDNSISQRLISLERFERSFLPKFNEAFTKVSSYHDPQELFVEIIEQVSTSKPKFLFLYLIDEVDDAFKQDENGQLKAVFKLLTNKIFDDYKNELRLMMYLAGTSEIVKEFISSNRALERRVDQTVIELSTGYGDEFEKIKDKIDNRIEGAYKGHKSFEEASQKIKSIDFRKLKSKKILSDFCRDYAGAVREIYEDYFSEEPERTFGGTSNELSTLIKSVCEQEWQEYIGNSELNCQIAFEPTLKAKDHTFNCYARLLVDGKHVATAYGGARNYELLSRYVDNFVQEMESVHFRRKSISGTPHDIAFIIAPGCSKLLKGKLKTQQIQWINPLDTETSKFSSSKTSGLDKNNGKRSMPVDINTADEEELLEVFRDTSIGQGIITEIVSNVPYKDLKELFSKVSNIGSSRQEKLERKLELGLICFKFGVFISYNRKDKARVIKIVEKLKKLGIAVWLDTDELYPGDVWQQKLEDSIESNMVRTVAVFIGKNGLGPWQQKEINAFRRKDVSTQGEAGHNYTIIPVILRSRGERPQVPSALQDYGLIDLNNRKPDPIQQLADAIKKAPNSN